MITIRLPIAAAVLALFAIGSAHAATVTYNNRAAFTAASGSLTNIDFEAQDTTPGGFTYYGSSGLTASGVSFTAPLSSYLFVASPTAVNPAYQWGSGASLLFGSTNEGGNLVIQFGAGVFSFGFDLMAQADAAPDTTGGLIYNISIDGNPYAATTQARPNRAFFGITSDVALSTVTLTMTNTYTFRALPIIDNVSFGGSATAVPEPGSLGLAGLALALAGLGFKRRR